MTKSITWFHASDSSGRSQKSLRGGDVEIAGNGYSSDNGVMFAQSTSKIKDRSRWQLWGGTFLNIYSQLALTAVPEEYPPTICFNDIATLAVKKFWKARHSSPVSRRMLLREAVLCVITKLVSLSRVKWAGEELLISRIGRDIKLITLFGTMRNIHLTIWMKRYSSCIFNSPYWFLIFCLFSVVSATYSLRLFVVFR